MARTFIERWFVEGGVALDIIFDEELARFEVCSEQLVVFTSAAFVEVLRFCLEPDDVPELVTESIELSPWDPEE